MIDTMDSTMGHDDKKEVLFTLNYLDLV